MGFLRTCIFRYPRILLLLACSALCTPELRAQADFSFPDQRGQDRGPTSAVEFFDWQDSWGTIHMNTDADRLLDPGKASTQGNEEIPCRGGANVCDKAAGGGYSPDTLKNNINRAANLAQSQVGHGIKFDIKNSVLNCMSKVVPNSPIFNGGDSNPFAANVCSSAGGRIDRAELPVAHSLVYVPLWHREGTDNSTSGSVQRTINNCVRDVFGGKANSPLKALSHPVEHAFTKQEVKDLCGGNEGGCRMPDKYYRYKLEDKWRVTTDTNIRSNTDVSDWAEVPNKSSDLARIRAFRVKLGSTFGSHSDVSGLYIVDPSDFFDLRHYMNSGRYDSGFSEVENGQPKSQDTCPILGVSGYGGICDPSGKAGCNLAVYGIGAVTNFTDRTGHVSSFENYPIKWSGYVKAWKIITREQYLKNTQTRRAARGGKLYAGPDRVNENPVLMVHRSDDYCDVRERYSKNVDSEIDPDLPCIQYKQYQKFERKGQAPLYTFVDLFMPDVDIGLLNTHALSKMYTHDRINGLPVGAPHSGNFTDDLVPQVKTSGYQPVDAISRLDYDDPSTKKVMSSNVGDWGFVEQGSTRGAQPWLTIGGFSQSAEQKASAPQSFPVEAGTKVCFRLPANNSDSSKKEYSDGDLVVRDAKKEDWKKPSALRGTTTRCACVTHKPSDPTQSSMFKDKELFVGTNVQPELLSLVKGTYGSNVEITNCTAQYQTYRQQRIGVNLTPKRSDELAQKEQSEPNLLQNPNKSTTWLGTLNCGEIKSKPACNETKIITAQRVCMLGDGVGGSCGDCKNAPDPDENLKFDLATVAAGGLAEVIESPETGSSCFFRAACFAVAAAGCPTAGASGGHIFCVTGDTKITMADGGSKSIDQIQAGESVRSFRADRSTSRLRSSKVESVAVTEGQRVLKVSLGAGKTARVLKITPEHKIVLSSGRSIVANDLREGDELLNARGGVESVTGMEFDVERVTVYNLVLDDDADGYVADGIRVLSYPSQK